MKRLAPKFLLLALCSPTLCLAGDPINANEATGLPTYAIPSASTWNDHISVYSGDLEISIPIGPRWKLPGMDWGLNLTYSSKIWRLWEYEYQNEPERTLGRQSSMGVGWKMTMGRVFQLCRYHCGSQNWHFEDQNGTLHPIEMELYPPGSAYYVGYTTDGTYMRAEAHMNPPYEPINEGPLDYDNIEYWSISLGNGVHYVFDEKWDHTPHEKGEDEWNGWLLTEMRKVGPDPNVIESRVVVEYENTSGKEHCLKEIRDYIGESTTPLRTLSLGCYGPAESDPNSYHFGGVNTSVTMPSIDGSSQSSGQYSFTYDHGKSISLSASSLGETHDNKSLLTSISLPHNPSVGYSFGYDPNTGELTYMTLPTGSGVAYQYDTYHYRNRDQFNRDVHTRMVTQKTVFGPTGTQAVWNYYRHVAFTGETSPAQYFDFILVADPAGNQTKYINHIPYAGLGQFEGLAHTIEHYRGAPVDGNGNLTGEGELLLVVNHSYSDVAPYGEPPDVRLTQITTTYPDTGQVKRTLHSGVLPYGHFTETKEYGFGSLDTPERTTHRIYETLSPGANAKWLNFTKNALTDVWTYDSTGTILRKTERTYLGDGKVGTVRRYVAPPSATAEDVITTYQYFSDTGLLERVTTTGGDNSSTFMTRYEYEGPYLDRKVVLIPGQDPNNIPEFSYSSFDVDRDPQTGLIMTSRTPNGTATSYEYDKLRRLTRITPPSPELPSDISYPSLQESQLLRGPQGSARTLQREFLDSLGRHKATWRYLPDSTVSGKFFCYDKLDRKVFESEWVAGPSTIDIGAFCNGDPNAPELDGTVFEYKYNENNIEAIDPFGRIHRVIRADSSETTYSYAGPDSIVTVHGINGWEDPNVSYTEATTGYRRDAFGRLTVVDSPTGADAHYLYSAVGDLQTVELREGDVYQNPITQFRTFTYDGFGRVIGATTPEEGTVQYTGFDAAGNLIEKIESDGTKVSMGYDAAGRLLQVQEAQPNGSGGYLPAVTRASYSYDEAPDPNGNLSLGQLTGVQSFDDAGDLILRRTLNYGGLNGRLDVELTRFPMWDLLPGESSDDPEFKTCYEYNNYGLTSHLRYPSVLGCSASSTDVATVEYLYSKMLLEEVYDSRRIATDPNGAPVGSLIKNILYNTAGGVSDILFANDVQMSVEPDVMFRPHRITVKGSGGAGTTHMDTGYYSYDGAGNIQAIGRDAFYYDRSGRLTWASLYNNNIDSYTADEYIRQYWYDDFGNITDIGGKDDGTPISAINFGVDTQTNRVTFQASSPYEYDQRGNLRLDLAQEYLFSNRNRLVAAKKDEKTYPSGIYEYDAGGLRICKEDPERGERIFYVRDGAGQVLSEFVPSGAGWSEGFWQKDYFYALGRTIGHAEESRPKPPEIKSYKSGSLAKLEFGAVDEDVTSFEIYRKYAGGSWTAIDSVSTPATDWTDPDSLPAGGPRTYRVATAVSGTESVSSRGILMESMAFLQVPDPNVIDLTADSSEFHVTLRWNRAPDDLAPASAEPTTVFQGYNLWRAEDPNATIWEKLNTLPIRSQVFHDLGVEAGTEYLYELRGVSSDGSEDWGIQTSITPQDGTPPSVPLNVRANPGPYASEVTVAWAPIAEDDVTQVRIWRYEDPNGAPAQWVLAGTADPNFTAWTDPNITSLPVGDTYTYAVSVKDDAGNESGKSASVEARPRVSSPAAPDLTLAKALVGLVGHSVHLEYSHAGSDASSYSEFRVYRREHGYPIQPWTLLFSDPVTHTYPPAPDPPTHEYVGEFTDGSTERCKVYDYVVSGIDLNGDETEDSIISTQYFILQPESPTAAPAVANKVRFDSQDFVVCSEIGSAYAVAEWILLEQSDPNGPITEHTFLPGGNIKLSPPPLVDPNGNITTDPNNGTSTVRAYALKAKVYDVLGIIDPNDPSGTFMSQDICVNTDREVVADDTACPDLDKSQDAPPPPPSGCCVERIVYGDQWQDETMPTREGLVLIGGGTRADAALGPLDYLITELDSEWEIAHHSTREDADTSDQDRRHWIVRTAQVLDQKRFLTPLSVYMEGLGVFEVPSGLFELIEAPAPDLIAQYHAPTKTIIEETRPRRFYADDRPDAGGIWFGPLLIDLSTSKSFEWEYSAWDHLGSTRVITDESGALTWEAKYLPYGGRIPGVGQGDSGNTHQFTGHERDAEAGIDYMKARYLVSGRFLSVDPLMGYAGDPQTLNRYAYVGNNPIGFDDPLGMVKVRRIKFDGYAPGPKPKKEDQPDSDDDISTEIEGDSSEPLDPIKRGEKAILSDEDIGNIVFNETRSLSGERINEARGHITHIIINGDEQFGSDRDKLAGTANTIISGQLSSEEKNTLESIRQIVADVRTERAEGIDPTDGAVFFGFRDVTKFTSGIEGLSTMKRFGTQRPDRDGILGPFRNSWASQDLGGSGIYFVPFR